MQEISIVTAILTGFFYLIASYRLLRLNWQTGERPEFWLGIYFAATGQWFLIFNAPFFFGLESLPPRIEYGIESIYAASVIPYLLFIRSTFRPRSPWATALVGVSTLCLLAGAGAAGLRGYFSNRIDDPAFLLQWVSYTIPSLWMSAEGLVSHAAAKKRVRMELCIPIVANRYLLFAGFGFCQVVACLAELLWAQINSTTGLYFSSAIGLMSGAEFASVGFLWLAFFPPLFYRRWIDARAAARFAAAEEG
jgi:hypothetical protein